jgi:hypothetical protein
MLKTISWLFPVLTFFQTSNERRFKICDLNTKQPIPFTTIRSIDFKMGTYADVSGYVIVNNAFTDSLLVSSIGYANKKISQREIKDDTIYLQAQVAELKPIIVKQRKLLGEKTLGIQDGKKSTVWGSGGFGDEFAQIIYFPDTNKVYKIKTISIGAERFDETIPMLLHIYTMGVDGLPNEDIMRKKIFLTKDSFKKANKKIIVDVSAENILLTESACFVGVEWLPVPTKGQRLPTTALLLTNDKSERLTYTRAFFYSKDKWVRTLSTQNQVNPNNTIISILVDVLE